MISLVITEDQLMLRKAMVQLIEMHEEMNVIKDFENGVEALEFIENNLSLIHISEPTRRS